MKIIKLTESDLTRIVKRVIKEEKSSKQDVLKKQVLKHGWEFVANMIGFDNLYKIGFNNDYNEFLNLFNNLDIVQSEKNPDQMLYRFEKGKNMMVYDRKNGYIYINYDDVWAFFSKVIGLNYSEIRKIMMMWLDEVYNLRGVVPIARNTNRSNLLD